MRRAPLLVLIAVAGAALWWARRADAPKLKIATFNIECFGGRDRGRGGVKYTDLDRLRELIGSLDADVVAVQEIEDGAGFAKLVDRIGGYRLALSRCGGGSGMKVGFLWREGRVAFEGSNEFGLDASARGRCDRGERRALLGKFRRGEARFELLAVHLAARADEEKQALRREQWASALAILAERRAAGAEVGMLGDTNSTGFLDEGSRERRFIEDNVAAAGLELRTRDLACSEYFAQDRGTLTPSMLDHLVLSPGFPVAGPPRVAGYCAEAACRPLARVPPPADYAEVSDHCPVVIGE